MSTKELFQKSESYIKRPIFFTFTFLWYETACPVNNVKEITILSRSIMILLAISRYNSDRFVKYKYPELGSSKRMKSISRKRRRILFGRPAIARRIVATIKKRIYKISWNY